MPELPDVEIFKQYLDATALHQTIAAVEVKDAMVLGGISPRSLSNSLKGRKFESTTRYGKHLLVALDQGSFLTLHFGMTGFLKYFKDLNQDPEHDRVLISFENAYHLAYVCQRKLGEVRLTDDAESFIQEKNLGPDALALEFKEFKRILAGKRGSIKSFLMNQKYLAGIGNIYSDDILFQAGLHPQAEVKALDEKTQEKLFRSMRTVLQKAIAWRADPGRFPDSYLLPHRRGDGLCPRGHGGLEKVKVSGRTAYLCPACQAKP